MLSHILKCIYNGSVLFLANPGTENHMVFDQLHRSLCQAGLLPRARDRVSEGFVLARSPCGLCIPHPGEGGLAMLVMGSK